MADKPRWNAGDAAALNRGFYDALWSQAYLSRPERFNTWPVVAALLPASHRRLEVGPGLRPRLPLAGTHFLDLSPPVVARLNSAGALAQHGDVGALPFQDQSFDLVCAFDIMEHVDDDARAWSELTRVLKPGGFLLVSVPLHDRFWTPFDELVGHVRRYHPAELGARLVQHGLLPQRSAPYGMQPNNPVLLKIGMWFLKHRRSAALSWYNRVFLPLGLYFQKPLQFHPGFPAAGELERVAEIILVCRREIGSEPSAT